MTDRNSLRTTKKAQNRCCNNLFFFCVRYVWPGNVTETSSTENFWAILQESAKELQTVISVKQFTRQLQEAMSQISPDVLYTGVRHTGRHLIFHHN